MRQMAICDIDPCHGCDDLETFKRHNRLETGVACVVRTNEVQILLEGYYHFDSDLQGAAEMREVITTCVERMAEIPSTQTVKHWVLLR